METANIYTETHTHTLAAHAHTHTHTHDCLQFSGTADGGQIDSYSNSVHFRRAFSCVFPAKLALSVHSTNRLLVIIHWN